MDNAAYLTAFTSPTTQTTQWISAYAFFDDVTIYGHAADRVILEVVNPLSRQYQEAGIVAAYFFVRYGEAGSHVRWRLAVDASRVERVKSDLDRVIRELAPSVQFVTPETIGLSVATDATQEPSTSLIRKWGWFPYVPELDRYGGPIALRVAEDIFCASSYAAVAVLGQLQEGRSHRLGQTLLCTLGLLTCFARARPLPGSSLSSLAECCHRPYMHLGEANQTMRSVSALEHSQRDRTRDQVASILHQVTEEDSLPTWLSLFLQNATASARQLYAHCVKGEVQVDAKVVDDWSVCLNHVIPSYVHMLNNRLGITRREEILLGTTVYHALQSLGA